MRAAVPETAVQKDSQLTAWVTDIRFAGELLPVQAVATESVLPERAAQQKFWLGVFALVAAHVAAHTLLGGERRGSKSVFLFLSGGHSRMGYSENANCRC